MEQKKIVVAVSLAMSLAHQAAHAQFDAVLNLSDLNGQNGFVINGENSNDGAGHVVSAAGDINGDGIDDVAISSIRAAPNGELFTGSCYVVFGSAVPIISPLNLVDINSLNGIKINGVSGFDTAGQSISAAGDINGDGIDDLIIGANGADPNGNDNAGSSYVVFGSDNGLANPFNLNTINGSNGFIINGVSAYDFSGSSVSTAGDVNGDGIGDVIIGAPYADPDGNIRAGSSYVVFGTDNPFPNPFNLENINSFNGIRIDGVANYDFSGRSVSNAGDINGDGIDDVIIAADGADPNVISEAAGSIYLVFGSDSGLANPLKLNTINGQNGIVINGVADFDRAGRSVSAAGDVNGDGVDDLIIGAPGADPNGISNAGSIYVVFGSTSGLTDPFELSSINGTNGFVINGVAIDDLAGTSVSSAGDVNGDGVDDLIVGAYYADPNSNNAAGSSYVVFGSKNMFPNPLALASLNGSNGFVINGETSTGEAGRSVSAAGDVNGDGIDDVIIGASRADPNGNTNAGSSYVVFGNDGIFNDGFE